MVSKPFKKQLTPEEEWARDRSRIHVLVGKVKKVKAGYSDDNYRDLVLDVSRGRCDSSKELKPAERRTLIDRLQELAGEEPRPQKKPWTKQSYPNRPRNMDHGEERAAQLGKIEALLTIGKLPWKYADSIAKQMRLADKVQWVPTDKLHFIITALTKKAQKEGWDLSGAR
ncbi:regulatory protein GemA [Geomonas sp. Red32]|uniref:phage protein GemA/Gp16 family protein n=1 Tax=Geomonas sp. Red32 TaxID=2912856 RepID=UPI00202CB7FA|nr:phage protein GemA/Gp16 family protein [Geomonas sp. Red32]MCM0081800.1 regulatory protein GemA [Geomonas sp. Red32]